MFAGWSQHSFGEPAPSNWVVRDWLETAHGSQEGSAGGATLVSRLKTCLSTCPQQYGSLDSEKERSDLKPLTYDREPEEKPYGCPHPIFRSFGPSPNLTAVGGGRVIINQNSQSGSPYRNQKSRSRWPSEHKTAKTDVRDGRKEIKRAEERKLNWIVNDPRNKNLGRDAIGKWRTWNRRWRRHLGEKKISDGGSG